MLKVADIEVESPLSAFSFDKMCFKIGGALSFLKSLFEFCL